MRCCSEVVVVGGGDAQFLPLDKYPLDSGLPSQIRRGRETLSTAGVFPWVYFPIKVCAAQKDVEFEPKTGDFERSRLI